MTDALDSILKAADEFEQARDELLIALAERISPGQVDIQEKLSVFLAKQKATKAAKDTFLRASPR